MNGPIAQAAALVCYGNGFLAGLRTSFFPANSTCRYCDRINFVETPASAAGRNGETDIAGSPDAWFEYLKRNGASGLTLARGARNQPEISDRMSAGFVGGGEAWTIRAMSRDGRSRSWQSRWEVWNKDAPEQGLWRVTYGCVGESKDRSRAAADLPAIRDELAASLRDAHEFSRRNSCSGFTERFASAIAALAGDAGAGRVCHKDLAPAGVLSDEALRMLDACQHAWVFGGMGSWNDLGFDGEEARTYERVSERLFRTVNRGIAAAASSSCRAE